MVCAVHGKRGADRRACIVRRGRYEHIGEFTGSPDPFIGHAIERDAAGKTQIFKWHSAFDASYERRDRGIRRRLQCCGHVGMPLQNFSVRVPRRAGLDRVRGCVELGVRVL